MKWLWLLFSFRGRINRAKYWLAALIYLIAGALSGLILGVLQFVLGQSALVQIPMQVLSVVVELAMTVSGLAVAVKRLHDRDRSAWWLLLFYLFPAVAGAIGVSIAMITRSPIEDELTNAGSTALIIGCALAIAAGIWGFVEIGCLRGTVGYNRYGPDPLKSSLPPTPSARRVAAG